MDTNIPPLPRADCHEKNGHFKAMYTNTIDLIFCHYFPDCCDTLLANKGCEMLLKIYNIE